MQRQRPWRARMAVGIVAAATASVLAPPAPARTASAEASRFFTRSR